MTFHTTAERRAALRRWASGQELITQSAWARRCGLSATAARRDFLAIADLLEPIRQATKVVGYRSKERN